MTVRELIERLQDFDPDAEVRIAQPTHDHWGHVKAAKIDDVDELEITHSAYHDADIIEEAEEAGDYRPAVILQ